MRLYVRRTPAHRRRQQRPILLRVLQPQRQLQQLLPGADQRLMQSMNPALLEMLLMQQWGEGGMGGMGGMPGMEGLMGMPGMGGMGMDGMPDDDSDDEKDGHKHSDNCGHAHNGKNYKYLNNIGGLNDLDAPVDVSK